MTEILRLATLALALSSLCVHAGRPLATEDAGVLEPGGCEWESFTARNHERNSASLRTLSTQVGCGVGASSQLALAIARQWGGSSHSNALTLGGKTGLIERKDDGAGVTLAWSLAAGKQTGTALRHEHTALNLVVSKELTKELTGHANLGAAHSKSAAQSAVTWNLAGEYALGNGLDVMAEFYGEQHNKPWLGTGLRWAVTEKFNLDASYARQSGAAQARLFTLGAKLAF